MSSTKRFFVAVVLLCAGIAAGLMFTASMTARAFGYNRAAFGSPMLWVGGVGIYSPAATCRWMFRYSQVEAVNNVLTKNFNIGLLFMFLPFCAMVPAALRTRRTIKNIHGSSRWAREDELPKMGLMTNSGCVIGRYKTRHRGWRYLTHDGKEHILAFAPTRSGKGVGLVVPSLLAWRGSTIVHDLKAENWMLTAGFRSRMGPALYFNPGDPESIHYNPLDVVRLGINEAKDVQMIADILVDPEGSSEKMDHWAKTGHALLVGCILHVLYSKEFKVKSLRTVADLLSDPQRSAEDVFEDMMGHNHFDQPHPVYGNSRTHPIVAACAREMLNKAPNERSGVISTGMSFLSLYRDPIIAANTADSDFTIHDLMDGERPVSLYLVVPPSDTSRTKSLMRLVLQQICRRLTERLHKPKHRMLMMLDEFPALGRLDFFESALAFVAGYEIKAYLITQSLNQLEKAYGQNNSILDNCHVRVTYAPNDERTAKRISELLGTTTVLAPSSSESGKKFSIFLSQESLSYGLVGRPLLTPGEIMQIEADRELIFIANQPPIQAWKMRYYEEPGWDKLTKIPPPDKPRTQAISAQPEAADAASVPGWTSGRLLLLEYGGSVVKVVKTRISDTTEQSRTDYHLVQGQPLKSKANIVLSSLRQQTPGGVAVDMFFRPSMDCHMSYFRGIPEDSVTVERGEWTFEDPTGILRVVNILDDIDGYLVNKSTDTKSPSQDAYVGKTQNTVDDGTNCHAENLSDSANNGNGKHRQMFSAEEVNNLHGRVYAIMQHRGLSCREASAEIIGPQDRSGGRTLGKFISLKQISSKESEFAKKLLAWVVVNEEQLHN